MTSEAPSTAGRSRGLAAFCLCASLGCGTALAEEGVRVTPISGGLGLFDLEASAPPGVEALSAVVLLDRPGRAAPLEAPLRPVGRHDADGVWGGRLMAGGEGGGEVRFRVVWTTPEGDIERGPIEASAEPEFPTPDWAKGAVWYQIFPERFRNANPHNDPAQPGVFRPAWNSPWFEVSLAEVEANWMASASLGYTIDPDVPGGFLYNSVWHRRYGGDLQGVVEKLDHIRSLGVTAIYFCPVFEARSMHKYDAADFRHIDANLGHTGVPRVEYEPHPDETADPETWVWTPADIYFLEVLLPEARKRGMRVIIDGVWNHTGREFWAFQDVLEHGRDSEFAEWFQVRFNDEGEVVGWRAWDRENGYLPAFRQVPDSDGGNLHPEVKQHIFDVTRRWMAPDGDVSRGIDGWRLDVAAEVPQGFWREWHKLVRNINPDALTIAEIWFPATDFLRGDQFDAQMNYPFAYPVMSWLGTTPGTTASQLRRALEAVFIQRPEVDLVQMNQLDSHDVERIYPMLNNPGRGYDQQARLFERPAADRYDPTRPPEEIYRDAMLGAAIQAMYIGAPMIYYGNEFGMTGADDPDNRKPTPWPDRGPYHPDDRPMPELVREYAAWFNLRSDPTLGPVLRYGAVRHLDAGREDVLSFVRQLNELEVLVVVNRSRTEAFDAAGLLESLHSKADGPRAGSAPVATQSARWWLIRR